MKINRTKTDIVDLDSLPSGSVFLYHNKFTMKTKYIVDLRLLCIDIESGDYVLLSQSTVITPVEAEVTIL